MLCRGMRRTSLVCHRLSPPRPQKTCERYQSSSHESPTPIERKDGPMNPVQEQLSGYAGFTTDLFIRFLKYSAIGFVAVTLTTINAFEGAHIWVENIELAAEKDEDVKKWQWDVESERWSGGSGGGTDPGLGFLGRHAVRAAWMAQNWGIGSEGSVMSSNAFSGRARSGASGLNVVEARLEVAQSFLNIALKYAQERSASGQLRAQTIAELQARHANIMERMGQRDALYEARSEYERVWAGQPGKGIDAARTAVKLGDLSRRLGEYEDALSWWSRAMYLVKGSSGAAPAEILATVPDSVPTEPLAQRTFVSTLVSLSAFYATTGQLRKAKAVEESSLALLQSIPQSKTSESASPPESLHAFYILHRSALLSIHLAEVLYARSKKQTSSLEWLARAAESSERVALSLTGLPAIHPDAPESQIPHPPSTEAPLIPVYAKSISLKRPAKSLLRDARRTAAEAWSLTGILTESHDTPGSKERALECYERALGWAGVAADRAGGIGKPGEGTLEDEWKALWSNYVRVREAVKNKASGNK